MRIKITADSVLDLPKELIENHDIAVAPLYVIRNGKEFRDGVDITCNDIYRCVEEEKGICNTAAVNVDDYENMFSKLLESYDAVIHLSLGSEYSACYQNAKIAAENFEGRVFLVDSKNLSSGTGLLVLSAVDMVEGGETDPTKIVEKLEDERERIDMSFIISTLKYLHRGGRCSSIAALGANVLQLKPCVEVKNTMEVGKKYRGTMDKVVPQYIEERVSCGGIDPHRCIIVQAEMSKEKLHEAVEIVKKYVNFEDIVIAPAGCTIATHCGPNAIGIVFLRN